MQKGDIWQVLDWVSAASIVLNRDAGFNLVKSSILKWRCKCTFGFGGGARRFGMCRSGIGRSGRVGEGVEGLLYVSSIGSELTDLDLPMFDMLLRKKKKYKTSTTHIPNVDTYIP